MLLFPIDGCATHREAGAALVGTGLVVAVVTASAATEHGTLMPEGYSRSTSVHGGAATAGVAAGVALAAAGSALERERPDDVGPSSRVANGAAPRRSWRLVRPASEREDSSP